MTTAVTFGPDAATLHAGSDSYPYTIVRTSPSMKTIYAQRDETMILSGTWTRNDVDYVTYPNPDAPVQAFTLRQNGCYVLKGSAANSRYGQLGIGHRNYYQDPSF